MSKKPWGLMTIGLIFSGAALAAEYSPVHWIATKDEEDKVDHAMADRLYDEACRWVEDRFSPNGKAIRPNLTIHVGEACPDSAISNACLSAASRELYIPHWDEAAPGSVVHATIVVGMMELMQQQDIPGVVKSLLTEDMRNFVDARGMAQRPANSQTPPMMALRPAERSKR